VKQTKLSGALSRNNLASRVFTPARSRTGTAGVAKRRSRWRTPVCTTISGKGGQIRRLVDSNIVGIIIWDFQGRIVEANDAFLDIVGYARKILLSGRLRWTELTPAEWRDPDNQAMPS